MAAGTARGMKGGHWLTTERGWCKAGSIMQLSEGVYCKTTRGDTDHPAYSAGSSTSDPDQRGCVTGFGWSRATGRGRSMAGSVTRATRSYLYARHAAAAAAARGVLHAATIGVASLW